MTLEVDFPRVLRPECLEDLSTVFYQSMYEQKDEAKKLIGNLDNYCSDLGFNERAFMYTYLAKAQHVARRMKKINRRDFVRKERTKFNKKISLEEAQVNKNSYLKKLEDLKNCELDKTKEKRENRTKSVEKRREIIKKGKYSILPAATGASLFVSSSYVPLKIASLISAGVGLGSFAAFNLLDKREIKKIEKITDEYHNKRKKIIQNYCEDKVGVEKYYSDRVKQVEDEYSSEILVIEKDKENEMEKHVSRVVRDLEKAWRNYGIDSKIDSEKISFGVMMHELATS